MYSKENENHNYKIASEEKKRATIAFGPLQTNDMLCTPVPITV
jgi:hypothetical protein